MPRTHLPPTPTAPPASAASSAVSMERAVSRQRLTLLGFYLFDYLRQRTETLRILDNGPDTARQRPSFWYKLSSCFHRRFREFSK